MPRKILHLDLDAFFCAVEERRDPSLSGLAFAVAGDPGTRSVVLSASYSARACGVRSAMPVRRALALCPQLVIVPPRHGVYTGASRQVMDFLCTLTPLIEQVSIDEAFLDLSDLPESGESLARKIQKTIRDQFALPCSIGVATSKLIAKTATDVGKASHRGAGPPYAILVVPPGQEAAFLEPLPIQALWGVGPKTAEHLAVLGIRTIGDLTRIPESQLVQEYGKMGLELARRARGLDDRPVGNERSARSISQETTFDRDETDRLRLERTLRRLSDGVGYRLRQARLAGTTVRIKLRWSDFTTQTRQTSLDDPVDQDGLIAAAALELFHKAWHTGQPVRLIGVGVSHLCPAERQLTLWDTAGTEKEHRLLEAVDELRQRYGKRVIFRASDLNKRR